MTATLEKSIRFVAVPGSHISDRKAAIYGPELVRLRAQGVHMIPSAVVDAARPRHSPLHDAFTWNDQAAAAERRLQQARYLLASIAFVPSQSDETEEEPEPIRYFTVLAIEAADGSSFQEYIPLNVVHEDPDLEREMLRHALAELSWFRRKYARLREIDNLVNWHGLDLLLAANGVPG